MCARNQTQCLLHLAAYIWTDFKTCLRSVPKKKRSQRRLGVSFQNGCDVFQKSERLHNGMVFGLKYWLLMSGGLMRFVYLAPKRL